MGNQLIAEGDASPADVLLTENSPAMAAVERAGLFADIDAETAAQVPEQYRPSSGKWTGVAARATVFAYNNFSAGANSDAGIGNRPGRHPDWTFSQNLKNYKSGWLFVIAD